MRIRPKSLSFTILLGALSALPPLSIDMGLPAFPTISAALRTSPGAVGLTLSLFMLGFAIAQLGFGPLSDRYGRRPVLLVGCGIFALAGVVCAAAPSIGTLIAWRLVQGAGAGAGMVVTLAIVRDLLLSWRTAASGYWAFPCPTVAACVVCQLEARERIF